VIEVTEQYLVWQRPEVEWAYSATVGRAYPSLAEALDAIASDEILTPDADGNDPAVVILPVDAELRVAHCSCYGRYHCAACLMAAQPVDVKELG
jgi:hypothetical protein